jgi:hypothetical protein
MGVQQLSGISDRASFEAETNSTRITKSVLDTAARVRTSNGRVKPMGVQQMTPGPKTGPFGVLETLSPEMAKDLGDVFSLARIGSTPAKTAAPDSSETARGALRFAGRVAVFLLAAVVAVSLTATAMYLMPLP